MQLEPENSRSHQIPKWLIWAVSQENQCQPTLLAHVVLSTSLISFALFCWVIMFYVGSLWEKEWTFIPREVTVEQLKSTKIIQDAKPSEQNRLIEQFEEIEVLSKTHVKIMGFFYKQYYISLSMMGTCASIAVISIFFISKSGWEKVNNAIINVFIVASGIFIFHGNMSLIFQHQDNLETSQQIYTSYLSLRNEFLSYLATGEVASIDKPSPSKFIRYVDGQMKSIGFVRLGFDPKSIPDFSKQFNVNGFNKQEIK